VAKYGVKSVLKAAAKVAGKAAGKAAAKVATKGFSKRALKKGLLEGGEFLYKAAIRDHVVFWKKAIKLTSKSVVHPKKMAKLAAAKVRSLGAKVAEEFGQKVDDLRLFSKGDVIPKGQIGEICKAKSPFSACQPRTWQPGDGPNVQTSFSQDSWLELDTYLDDLDAQMTSDWLRASRLNVERNLNQQEMSVLLEDVQRLAKEEGQMFREAYDNLNDLHKKLNHIDGLYMTEADWDHYLVTKMAYYNS